MTDLATRAGKACLLRWRRSLEVARHSLLDPRARVAGTALHLGARVRIEHRVRIEGNGTVSIGDDVWLGYRAVSSTTAPILLQAREPEARIALGDGTQLMNGAQVIAREHVDIGARVLVGPEALIYDSDFHGLAVAARSSAGRSAPVSIGDDVWLGSRAIVLKGVTIGAGAVVGAGSVVAMDVDPLVVVAGNPAVPVGRVPA